MPNEAKRLGYESLEMCKKNLFFNDRRIAECNYHLG